MRNLILLPVFILIAAQSSLFAQAAAAQDAVYLLDARAHQGIIIEQKPGEHIKLLRLPEGDTLQFEMEQIDYIAKIMQKTPVQAQAEAEQAPRPAFNQRQNFLMIHGWTGGGDYAFQGLGISLNHRLAERTEVGLGAHYLGQTSTNSLHDRQTIPLTADFRYAFSRSRNGRFSTHLAISAGYNFTLNRNYFDPGENSELSVSDGLYFSPGVAFRANILPNVGLMIDLGYQLSTGRVSLAETGQELRRKNWNNLAIRGSLFF